VTSLARTERAALCATALQAGEEAPTLCGGWTVKDLVVHLLVRERSPAAVGIAVSPLSGLTERAYRRMGRHDFRVLVEMLRNGPPALSPYSLPKVDALLNSLELFVHHEDIRRAQPGWVPRVVPASLADSLWKQLRLTARPAFRHAPDGVLLLRAGTDASITAKRGALTVALEGDPVELLLYAFNRKAAARVEIRGDDAAVTRLALAKIGL
jgi:uncharacterized protein (TIGR03085 family)